MLIDYKMLLTKCQTPEVIMRAKIERSMKSVHQIKEEEKGSTFLIFNDLKENLFKTSLSSNNLGL